MQDRATTLGQAFLDLDLEIAGRKLRKLTAGSILILQQLGNPLFAFEEGEAKAQEEGGEPAASGEGPEELEGILHLCGYVWAHTAQLAEVIEAVEDGEAGRKQYRTACRLLSLELDPKDLAEFGAKFTAMNERVKAGATEVLPEEGAPGKPVPSLTGSPATSGTLAGPETRSESGGFCGVCPSNEGSSTCTPGTGTMAAAADGSASGDRAENPSAIPLPSLPDPGTSGG